MMTDPAASRPGTHLDPDRMADLLEGLLDAASADEARAHLASCPVCSADFALISGESDLETDLGELLPPVPIPLDVVTRVEAALHREPPLGTGSTSGAGVSAAGAAGQAATATRPRRQRFRIALGALAGASLVIAGGFGVVAALDSSGSDSVKSSTNNAAGADAPSSQSEKSPQAAGAGTIPGGQMSPKLGAPSPDSGPTSTSNSVLNGLNIEQQAEALLGQHVMTPAIGTAAGVQCRPMGMVNGAKPITGEQTQYQGRTVWLLIYAKSGDPAVADVYVVDASGCTPDNPGQVIDSFEIPRA